jgi:hypothetical protein
VKVTSYLIAVTVAQTAEQDRRDLGQELLEALEERGGMRRLVQAEMISSLDAVTVDADDHGVTIDLMEETPEMGERVPYNPGAESMRDVMDRIQRGNPKVVGRIGLAPSSTPALDRLVQRGAA